MERANIIEDVGSELSRFLSTETIFGEPMVINNVTLVPVQSVSLGFGGSIGTGKGSKSEGQGSGSGAGAMLRPVAIVAITEAGEVQVYNFKGLSSLVDTIAEHLPEILPKIIEVGMGKKKANEEVSEEKVGEEELDKQEEESEEE